LAVQTRRELRIRELEMSPFKVRYVFETRSKLVCGYFHYIKIGHVLYRRPRRYSRPLPASWGWVGKRKKGFERLMLYICVKILLKEQDVG